jgi:opacity protein-like surface antigen
MKTKGFKILLLIAAVFLMGNTANSQIVKFKLGPMVGLTAPTGDYAGNTMEYYSGTKYGMNSGVNFGAIFKTGIGPFNLRISGSYAPLSNSGIAEPGEGFIETKSDMLIFSAGPEFDLAIPFSPIKPYLGVDLLFSSISGRTTFSDVDFIPDGTYDMQSATRVGLGFGAGLEYGIGASNVLDISFRYNLVNLFGKEYRDATPSDTRRLDAYLSLNDDADPLAGTSPVSAHPITTSRSISVFQIDVAFLFGF